MKENLRRMLELVEEVFNSKNDSDQIDVDENVTEKLFKLHPASLSSVENDDGPVVWVLIFPTTQDLMKKFIDKKITEKELFEQTSDGIDYNCIYLCSALVLPEYRNKGMATKLTVEAIEKIRKDHKIKNLFVWVFSNAGRSVAQNVAARTGLPLLYRMN